MVAHQPGADTGSRGNAAQRFLKALRGESFYGGVPQPCTASKIRLDYPHK